MVEDVVNYDKLIVDLLLKHGAKADVREVEGVNAMILFGYSGKGQDMDMDVKIIEAPLKAGGRP